MNPALFSVQEGRTPMNGCLPDIKWRHLGCSLIYSTPGIHEVNSDFIPHFMQMGKFIKSTTAWNFTHLPGAKSEKLHAHIIRDIIFSSKIYFYYADHAYSEYILYTPIFNHVLNNSNNTKWWNACIFSVVLMQFNSFSDDVCTSCVLLVS